MDENLRPVMLICSDGDCIELCYHKQPHIENGHCSCTCIDGSICVPITEEELNG